MLDNIVKLIESNEVNIEDDTIFCKNYNIKNLDILDFLQENRILENEIFDKTIGKEIDLELNIANLKSIGFYTTFNDFILKNNYTEPSIDYYIYDLLTYKNDNHDEILKYRTVIDFISILESIAKHNYKKIQYKNSIIYREDKSILLSYIYNEFLINKLNLENVKLIHQTIEILNENSNDKKMIFINELIAFVSNIEEKKRFEYLIENIKDYFDISNHSYQFYLRDFSFNKLKIELDNKTIEFAQKIQGVINDSQTKLIAIPTAFVLVFSTFDYDKWFSIKNISAIIGLFIFAIFLQLFISNQLSILNIIKTNIDTYKNTFKEKNQIDLVNSTFTVVDTELSLQFYRFDIIKYILWLIPSALFLFWTIVLFLH